MPSLEARHGGPSKSVLGLASSLARLGAQVDLLTTEPGPGWERSEGTLRVSAFHRDWPRRLCPSAGLRKDLAALRPDVVHHHALWLRTLHYAHQSCRASGARLVVSPRGMMDPWAWNHHQRNKALARLLVHPGALEAVDGWHATSGDEAAGIRALGFGQPVCVAPNGVARPSPQSLEEAATSWRQLLPAAGSRPIALFYSRFHRKKRLLELIDLWLEHGPRDWLLLVAGIPEEYTPRMIEDYVLRAGHSGRVRAFDGTRLPPPYAIASLFLLASHGENFGQSIAEALASGVPALVTDSTPWSGLGPAGAGWCVPWRDFGLALKAATAQSASALRQRGEAAREWVLREYSWERSARILDEFYRALPPGGANRPK